jgi:hypothetical protein
MGNLCTKTNPVYYTRKHIPKDVLRRSTQKFIRKTSRGLIIICGKIGGRSGGSLNHMDTALASIITLYASR